MTGKKSTNLSQGTPLKKTKKTSRPPDHTGHFKLLCNLCTPHHSFWSQTSKTLRPLLLLVCGPPQWRSYQGQVHWDQARTWLSWVKTCGDVRAPSGGVSKATSSGFLWVTCVTSRPDGRGCPANTNHQLQLQRDQALHHSIIIHKVQVINIQAKFCRSSGHFSTASHSVVC